MPISWFARLPAALVPSFLCLATLGVAVAEDAKAGDVRFAIVDEGVSKDALQAPPEDEKVPSRTLDPRTSGAVWIKREPHIDGDIFAEAHLIIDRDGKPAVDFRLTDDGRMRFAELTRANVGRRLAMVVNGTVIVAPFIRAEMNQGMGIISGNFTEAEARSLLEEMMGRTSTASPKPP
jgi:preprotein translocase subunit SecD